MIKTFILILLFSSVAYSQPVQEKYYVSAGFGISYQNSDELNNIINQFNSSPNVVKKMESFETFFGPTLGVGANYEKDEHFFNLEFGFALQFTGTKSAEITQPDRVRVNQDVQMRIQLINMEFQYFIKTNEWFNIGAGFSLNFGSMNIFERHYNRFASTPSYTLLNENSFFSYVGVTPNLSFNLIYNKDISVSIRPNYNFLIKSQNLSSLNSALNPGVTIPDLASSYFSGPGVALNFQFRIGK